MSITKRHLLGFTLIELMIVMVVAAILAAIAYPSYQNQMQRTRRSDGQAQLMEIMSAQERFYSARNTYTTDLRNLGYATAGNVPSDEGWYQITATACGTGIVNCVMLTATSQGAQAADGALTLNSRNQKTGNW
jgi:type IV pilus assembly protein PilE